MAHVLQPPSPLFASRGGTSIKSFKFRSERTTGSSPPSIGGDSTRRRAFGMSSLLGRRKNERPPLPDLDALVVSEKLQLLSSDPFARENMAPAANQLATAPSRRETESASSATSAAKQAPPKSRNTLFRKITTKLNRNRSRSPSPSRRAGPSAPANAAAQEARNAALRARGLLPPLPLSVQEQQQDMRIAIITEPEPGEQSGLGRRTTAANRVKEEWEAKNRERLTEFRFGGSPAASPLEENFPSSSRGGLDAVKEVDTPLPSPRSQDVPPEFGGAPQDDEQEQERKQPRAPPPTLNLGRVHHLSPPLMQAWSDIPPDPPSMPLSPSPGTTESGYSSLISAFSTPPSNAQFTPMSPTFTPLPPSPSTDTHDGSETPRGRAGDCTPRRPASPTPPSPRSQSIPQSIPRLDASASSESESSLGVPSLLFDAEAQSQTTVSTSDSASSPSARMRGVPATTVRNSTFEPAAHHAISVIVESPREERDFVLSPVTEDAPSASAPKLEAAPPRRRATAPLLAPAPAAVDRRKSLTVFKRGKGEGLSAMGSIRRSIGLGRAKSAGGPPAGFAPALLPPSPTLPAEFAAQQGQQRVEARARPGHAKRRSVNPKMHDRGTILFEVNNIEDEESRRMTEVAFM